jgi:hypothetical protein
MYREILQRLEAGEAVALETEFEGRSGEIARKERKGRCIRKSLRKGLRPRRRL